MAHVDALSRASIEEDNNAFDDIIKRRLEVLVTTNLNPAEQLVQAMQHDDPEVREIINALARGHPDKQTAQNYVLSNGLIYPRLKTVDGNDDYGLRHGSCGNV